MNELGTVDWNCLAKTFVQVLFITAGISVLSFCLLFIMIVGIPEEKEDIK